MDRCRLCLKSSQKLRSLFDREDDVVYIDMLTSISNMKIKTDDKLTNLCYQCCQKLREAFHFKNMIEMSNLKLCEESHPKKIHFNTLDEIKIKVNIKVEKKICKNQSNTTVLENLFNSDMQWFCFNNTLIKRVKSLKIVDESETNPLNIYDYVKTFKTEPNDTYLDQDFDYDGYDVSNSDYETEMQKSLKERKKLKIDRKGKEKRNAKEMHPVTKRNKYINETLRVKIKPVFLDDLRIVRTKGKKRRQADKAPIKCTKQMCSFCGLMTASIKSHMLTHTGKKTHKCDVCAKSFYTETHLRAHKKKHEFQRKYKCDKCIAKFCDPSFLKRHMAVHNEERTFVCHICNKSFKRKSNLSRHLIHHNSANKNVKCDQCNMTFFSNTGLKNHLRVHTGERPYRCELCSQRYSYKHDFNRHCYRKHAVFLKRRPVYVMDEEVLIKERELMRVLMLRLHGVAQGEDPYKEFEGPQGYKALEQAIKLLESKQLPVDVQF